jgi:hypothetical protein
MDEFDSSGLGNGWNDAECSRVDVEGRPLCLVDEGQRHHQSSSKRTLVLVDLFANV